MEKNFLFVWIPKTAGTSIFAALAQHTKMKLLETQEKRIPENLTGGVSFGHCHVPAVVQESSHCRKFFNESISFCFVRNPFDRMVSLYLHFLIVPRIMPMSFKEFCYLMLRTEDYMGNRNINGLSQALPQYYWSFVGMDFIGRFETLEEDFKKLCQLLGMPPLPLPHKRKAPNRKKLRVSDYYDSETEKIVQKLYANDFKYFGYPDTLY